ncbi:pantetheine-phosphate adenylyltransferase [Christensenella tenuis]|jgi:pantetheine-phosphate adenylyltransferase|uniref:Phosphopantetheine adenylyltransferase n=1 Tax=Christensenella tenuis TaxID=2763033 RepID=A0ABR7ED44_9FIRM|nr:pantetheine-phosphate adenylyltransferase [Christensenella tenuis]MBC5647241.1 pantetheine-phosphate adenylyltransferase [Christensenella tenuis]
MKACIYPGSFDPITKGHMDIIDRACNLFPRVYVGVLNNTAKKNLFSVEERIEMIRRATSGMEEVEVVAFDGLLVELMKKLECKIIIRGLRTGTDLELEQQLSVINGKLFPGAETVALLSKPETYFISSSAVRELIEFRADISDYVPKEVADMINGGIAK